MPSGIDFLLCAISEEDFLGILAQANVETRGFVLLEVSLCPCAHTYHDYGFLFVRTGPLLKET